MARVGMAILFAPLACAGVTFPTLTGAQQPRVYERSIPDKTCANDDACASGHRCVKDSVSTQGVCAQGLNELGQPMYLERDPTSSGPGKGNCSTSDDCPARSTCEKAVLASRGNCMR